MWKPICWILLLLPVLAAAEPLRVFVSVLPLKTFVEKVGGEHVDVRAMVRPGYSPHTYAPTPRQIAALSGAALYVRTGVPFERAWMERIRSANRSMKVQDAREGIELRKLQGHGHDGDGDHGNDPGRDGHGEELGQGGERGQASDPHVWTSPPLAKRMAGNIRDALVELDPGNARDYRRGYEEFAAEIDGLESDIRAQLKDVPGARFMVFHPAWGYFAENFGLIQVAIEREGKEPGPRTLGALIEQATREQVKVIFVQPQFSRKLAEQVARAIGGRVIAVDPLAPDYADNLRNLARQIAGAVEQ